MKVVAHLFEQVGIGEAVGEDAVSPLLGFFGVCANLVGNEIVGQKVGSETGGGGGGDEGRGGREGKGREG